MVDIFNSWKLGVHIEKMKLDHYQKGQLHLDYRPKCEGQKE